MAFMRVHIEKFDLGLSLGCDIVFNVEFSRMS